MDASSPQEADTKAHRSFQKSGRNPSPNSLPGDVQRSTCPLAQGKVLSVCTRTELADIYLDLCAQGWVQEDSLGFTTDVPYKKLTL